MAANHGHLSTVTTATKQLPRDVIVMHTILKEMGVTLHEPRVVNQMLEFVYRFVTNTVEEARMYSGYAKKKAIDAEDIRLAVKNMTSKSFTTAPPREMLLDLAKNKNTQPLPLLKSTSGLRLPPDRFCLTQPNYQLQFYKKAIASSSSQPSNVRLPGSSAVFKTPLNPPLHKAGTNGTGTTYTPVTVNMSGGLSQVNLVSQGTVVTGVKRKLSDDEAWS